MIRFFHTVTGDIPMLVQVATRTLFSPVYNIPHGNILYLFILLFMDFWSGSQSFLLFVFYYEQCCYKYSSVHFPVTCLTVFLGHISTGETVGFQDITVDQRRPQILSIKRRNIFSLPPESRLAL